LKKFIEKEKADERDKEIQWGEELDDRILMVCMLGLNWEAGEATFDDFYGAYGKAPKIPIPALDAKGIFYQDQVEEAERKKRPVKGLVLKWELIDLEAQMTIPVSADYQRMKERIKILKKKIIDLKESIPTHEKSCYLKREEKEDQRYQVA